MPVQRSLAGRFAYSVLSLALRGVGAALAADYDLDRDRDRLLRRRAH
jgi:hypothetical protein